MFSIGKSSYESRIVKVLQDKFLRISRRNKILAKWVAGRLGFSEEEKNKYVRKLVVSYIFNQNDQKIVEKIVAEFHACGVKITEEEVAAKIRSIETRVRTRGSYNEDTL